MIEGKGHQHIINALPYVNQNIHLIICGEGYYKDLADLADGGMP